MWNFLPSFRYRKVNLAPGWARSSCSGHCCPAAWYCALKKNVQKQYTDKEFDSSTINLWDNDKGEQPIVFLPSVSIDDSQLLYAACTTKNFIVAVTTLLNGVDKCGSIQQVRLFLWSTLENNIQPLYCFREMFVASSFGIAEIKTNDAFIALYASLKRFKLYIVVARWPLAINNILYACELVWEEFEKRVVFQRPWGFIQLFNMLVLMLRTLELLKWKIYVVK